MIVAIDGPAGTGKSTVARRLAERLGFRYLDTGAMYRALTWLALERGVDLDDEEAMASLARESETRFDQDRISIAGRDVTDLIRTAEIDRVVSSVARHPAVRAVLRERQRILAEEGNAVMEGRDIGSVVVPDADVKIYLVADAGSARGAARPSGRGSARTRSPPTCVSATSATHTSCGRRRTRRRSIRPSFRSTRSSSGSRTLSRLTAAHEPARRHVVGRRAHASRAV